jgi:antitoxin (DNA-binding transcriptional repressor) of toxin-antitoxin stability system
MLGGYCESLSVNPRSVFAGQTRITGIAIESGNYSPVTCLLGLAYQSVTLTVEFMTKTFSHTTDQTVAQLLKIVENGDDVLLTRDGKPLAVLTAALPAPQAIASMQTFDIPETFYDNLPGGY